MWNVFAGTVVRPVRTFTALDGDLNAGRYGAIALLVVVAVRVSGIGRWWLSVLAAVPLVVLYGLPVGLFVR